MTDWRGLHGHELCENGHSWRYFDRRAVGPSHRLVYVCALSHPLLQVEARSSRTHYDYMYLTLREWETTL
jgi:hypothetical protein